jgi:phospholipase C
MFAAIDRSIGRRRLRRRDDLGDAARLPDPTRPPGTDCLPAVDHIVLLMMENHSFDNYFGTLGHGDGLAKEPDGGWGPRNEVLNGTVVPPHHFASTTQHPAVPTQSWHASHIQFAGGSNDGFVASIAQTVPGGDPRVAMGFWTAEDLGFYTGLAQTFALADRWYSSLLGPTCPNRRFLIAATANGLIDDVIAGMVDYPRTGTIFDMLDRYGVTWVNYHHVRGAKVWARRVFGVSAGRRAGRAAWLAAVNFVPRALKVGLENLQFTSDIYPLGAWRCWRHLRHIDRFFDDCRAGTLPAVSIVDPDFLSCSEENPQDIQVGEGFAAEVVNAVMHSKAWTRTLLIWLYDEHGGYFDHVPPPPAAEPDDVLPRSLLKVGGPGRWLLQALGLRAKLRAADSGAGRYDRYGFRVPAVVVSPYAKRGYVSSTTYDHTSALKLIERKWNLPPLTERDAAADDPLDMVDWDKPTFSTPPVLPSPAVPWKPGRS